jgi:hypothetical protein
MKTTFLVEKEIQAKLKGGKLALIRPGKVVSLESAKAEALIKAGKLKPLAMVENMTLEQFTNSRLAIKLESSILNEVICFASNEGVAAELRKEGFVCYTAKELEALTRKQFQPDEIKKIHEVKTVFPGCSIIQ